MNLHLSKRGKLENKAKYGLGFLVGGILTNEAAVAVPLYLELADWKIVRDEIVNKNLFGSRTRGTATRTSYEVIKRLELLSDDELRFLAAATAPERRLFMWAAMCRYYEFVAEFAEEVLRDHFLLGTNTVTQEDFSRFVAEKSLWHEELSEIKPSTLTKLRTNLFLAMREAGLLTDDGTIITPIVTPELKNVLENATPSEMRYFPVFEN